MRIKISFFYPPAIIKNFTHDFYRFCAISRCARSVTASGTRSPTTQGIIAIGKRRTFAELFCSSKQHYNPLASHLFGDEKIKGPSSQRRTVRCSNFKLLTLPGRRGPRDAACMQCTAMTNYLYPRWLQRNRMFRKELGICKSAGFPSLAEASLHKGSHKDCHVKICISCFSAAVEKRLSWFFKFQSYPQSDTQGLQNIYVLC